MSAPGPNADNAIRSRDGKKLLDEVIHLMDKNNKLGLVKLVEDDENGENVKTLHFHPLPSPSPMLQPSVRAIRLSPSATAAPPPPSPWAAQTTAHC